MAGMAGCRLQGMQCVKCVHKMEFNKDWKEVCYYATEIKNFIFYEPHLSFNIV